MHRIILTIVLTALVAAPAGAQQLKMTFDKGLVSIDATSVPVRTLLSEWSKLGGTKVVGGDRVAGAPLTLKLVNVPEAQALEIVLRNVAGYMAAPRTTAAGASIYDRILVLATSAAPAAAGGRAAPAPNTAAGRPTAGTQRAIPPRFAPPDPADEGDAEEPDEEQPPSQQPVFTFPPPGQPGQQFGGNGAPVIGVNPATGAPQSISINPSPLPNEGASTGTGATPGFGVVGAPVPGVIQQPPTPTSQPAQRPQPGPMTRPPGGGV